MGSVHGAMQQEIMAYDPLPPPSAIPSVYDDVFASNQNPLSQSSFLGGLLTSLLPWVNPEGLPNTARPMVGREEFLRVLRDAEERVENENNVPQEARDWIQTLMHAFGLGNEDQQQEESD